MTVRLVPAPRAPHPWEMPPQVHPLRRVRVPLQARAAWRVQVLEPRPAATPVMG